MLPVTFVRAEQLHSLKLLPQGESINSHWMEKCVAARARQHSVAQPSLAEPKPSPERAISQMYST